MQSFDMPKTRRITREDASPRTQTGFRISERERARLHAITVFEDRGTESETIRALINRAYRNLPIRAQLPDDREAGDTAPLGLRRDSQ
jgi:hypothetical protein